LKLEKLEGFATRKPENGTEQIIENPFRLTLCRVSDAQTDTCLKGHSRNWSSSLYRLRGQKLQAQNMFVPSCPAAMFGAELWGLVPLAKALNVLHGLTHRVQARAKVRSPCSDSWDLDAGFRITNSSVEKKRAQCNMFNCGLHGKSV